MLFSSLIIPTIKARTGRSIIFLVVIFSIVATDSFAQWKQLFDFGSPVTVVYFKEFGSKPMDGFVGLNSISQNPNKVWRTLDGGKTWNSMVMSSIPKQGYADVGCFTFKDSATGWFASHWDGPRSIYRTTDGGNTWTDILYNASISPSIHYVPSTDMLFCAQASHDALPYIYSTDGQTFIDGPSYADFSGAVGIAFSDDLHGILTPPSASHLLPIAYTQDGGLTWNKTDSAYESYQPVGIPGTTIFFAISEFGDGLQKLMRSDNGGVNWYQTYLYPTHPFPEVTGTMQVGLDRRLFFQTSSRISEGIMMSADTGKTFISICGPTNDQDTRFYVRDSFIYAADGKGGLWLNSTGIGSNSTPQLSATILHIKPTGCNPVDTFITMTFFDSCNGLRATVKNISFTKNTRFAITSSVNAGLLHDSSVFAVHYDPQATGSDTAFLKLTFHLGYTDFDTTVAFMGFGNGPQQQVVFSMGMPATSFAGNVITIPIFPNKTLINRGLTSITFDLNYNNDLISFLSYENNTNCSVGTASINGRTATLPVAITNDDISLDSTKPIVTISFRTFLTDTISTPITMTNLKLNHGNADYAKCILSADTTSTSYTQILRCKEPTMQHYLQTKTVLFITSMRPNPTTDNIELRLVSAYDNVAEIEGVNSLGTVCFSRTAVLKQGDNVLPLSVANLSSGMYILRIKTPESTISKSFFKD